MRRAYRFAIGYFALFGVLLLISGGWLFYEKIGFTPQAITLYYLGGENAAGKSPYGLLETAVPHLGAMGLFAMVLGHFFLFAPGRAKRRAAVLSVAVFAAAALDIASGPFIAAGHPVWSWIKLAAFTILALLSTLLCVFILYYAFWHNWSPQRRPR